METLVEAEQEMDSIHFEKRQLIAQWHSSLLAITRREEALAAIKDAIHQQDEQERSIVNELGRFKKDAQEQQVLSQPKRQITAGWPCNAARVGSSARVSLQQRPRCKCLCRFAMSCLQAS